MKRWFCAIAAAMVLLCAWARADGAVLLHARAGYAGVVIEGEWVPIDVEVHAEDQLFCGVISVDVYQDSDTFDRIEMPVEVAAGETKSIRFSVLPQIRQRSFTVRLFDAGGKEAAKTEAMYARSIAQDALVIGAVGVDNELLREIETAEIRDVHGRLEKIGVVPLDEDCFMQTYEEINALDALLAGKIDQHTFSAEQNLLLDEWENRGGVVLHGIGITESMLEMQEMNGSERQENAPESPKDQAEYLLDRIAQELSNDSRTGGYANYTFGSGLIQSLRVGEGRSIFPLAALLLAYIAGTGAGLYLICIRRDKGWLLWMMIPAATLLCTALVLIIGAYMQINAPTAAQMHVAVIDEQGNQWTEESAVVSYAGQHRAEISAQDGTVIERRGYAYFNDYGEVSAQGGVMRDRVTLGDAPGIELDSGAAWLTRNLMIKSEKRLVGSIDASAWMEEDGLHVQVANHTDTVLSSALLLTEIGYAALGDIHPGDTAKALLRRAQRIEMDKNGDFLIPPDTAMPYSAGIYSSIRMLVDPELLAGDEYDLSKLSGREQYERSILSSKLGLANQVRQDGFACILIADTPQITCTPLKIDGEPFEKTASVSVLMKRIELVERSTNGYFYYPQGSFAAYAASFDDQGTPVMGEKEADTYVDWERIPPCFGFRLDKVNAADISEIRIIASKERKESQLCFEAYDIQNKDWIALEGGLRPTLHGDLLARVLSENREMFLRYDGVQSDAVYRPEIIVEGRESK